MNDPAVNSSPSASGYSWTECDTYNDGAGHLGGPSAGILMIFISNCFEFLVGAPCNLWFIRHILSKRSKNHGIPPADFFPLHQALAQMAFYSIIPIMFLNHYRWRSNLVMAVMQFLTGMGLLIKPMLLCLVCVERYMAVVRPLDYLRFKDQHYRWGCLCVSWCIYISLASAAVVARSSISYSWIFLFILVIDTYCCLSVLKALRKPPPGDKNTKEKGKVVSPAGRKKQKVRKVERDEPTGKGEMNSMKRKAFNTIAIIQTVLTLNYLPYIIVSFMGGLVPARTLKCQYLAMSLAAAISCSYLQPLLYMHRLRRLPCMTPRHK